jgi:hypothetical protein
MEMAGKTEGQGKWEALGKEGEMQYESMKARD